MPRATREPSSSIAVAAGARFGPGRRRKMAAVPLIVNLPDLTTRWAAISLERAVRRSAAPARAVRSITGTGRRAGASTSPRPSRRTEVVAPAAQREGGTGAGAPTRARSRWSSQWSSPRHSSRSLCACSSSLQDLLHAHNNAAGGGSRLRHRHERRGGPPEASPTIFPMRTTRARAITRHPDDTISSALPCPPSSSSTASATRRDRPGGRSDRRITTPAARRLRVGSAAPSIGSRLHPVTAK